MNIISMRGSIPTKHIVVAGIVSETDHEVLAFAMRAAGENASSLFGSYVVQHDDGTATVQLYTD